MSLLYRRNPYLRPLGEDELLGFGAKALEEVSARFTKGAPKTPTEEMEPLMIRLTHFIGEAKHRGLGPIWCCPTPPPVSATACTTSPAAWAAWETAVCWDDEYAVKRLAEVRAV